MFCTHCGKTIADNLTFCTNCGKRIVNVVRSEAPPASPITKPSEAQAVTPDTSTVICPSCRQELEVPSDAYGQAAECPGCNAAFVVPYPAGSAPALYSSKALTLWSILFTPLFGIVLQGMNWKTLKTEQKVKASKRWAIFGFIYLFLIAGTITTYMVYLLRYSMEPHADGTGIFIMCSIFAGTVYVGSIVLFLSWLALSAWKQPRHLRKTGIQYRKRSLLPPVLVAACMVAATCTGFFFIMDWTNREQIATSDFVRYFQSGDYYSAIRVLKKVNTGDSMALMAMSVMFKDGLGLEANKNMSFNCLDRIARSRLDVRESTEANLLLADLFSIGSQDESDIRQALMYYSAAGSKKWKMDDYFVLVRWCNHWNEEVLKRRIVYAQQKAGDFHYLLSKGVRSSELDAAIAWWSLAAMNGSVLSQLKLAAFHMREGNQQEVVRWLYMSASQGHVPSQIHMGEINESGMGVASNATDAAKWYMLADANTNALAQYKLALMHLDGGGGLKDEAKAAELLLNSITLCETVQTRAIEAGDLDERPPSIEDEGSYRTKLFMTIAKNWHQEIKQGEGDNGRFLQYLISTLPDLAILTETPALSDKDLDYACYKLAGLYLSGKPAPINDSEVARFFKDAAAKGISDKNISVERLRLYLTGLARKESGPTIRWPGEKAQSADVKEAEEDSLMRARQLEQEKAARELKAKEEQAARAKQEEEELRIKSGPLYNLRKNPMDKAELAKLKSSIQASQIPGEKCSWSIIYCLGMLATGNTSEGFAVRAYIGREFAQQDISVISDRNLSDMCGKCENGRCKLTCQKCKGTATCISCGGSGMRRGSGFDGQLRCLICNGNGICKECNATGSRTETCRACSGRGYSFSPDKCKSAYLGLLGSVDLSASETKPPEGQPREAQQAEKPPSRQDENRLQKAPPSLLNGLALYYDFAKDTRPAVKNTANNMSDGSVNCAAWSREGKFGGAYSFTAPDGRIRISWKTQIQDSFTIAAWVYPTKKTSLPTPSVTGQGALDGLAYVFAPKHGNNDKSAGIGLSVGINGAVVTEHADVHLPAVLTYPHQFDSAWHHFVVAVSGGQAVLYVDGQMVQQGVKSTRAHLLCPEELGIGGWRDRSVFTGMIDEVAVWTRKLSAADIKALYQNQ